MTIVIPAKGGIHDFQNVVDACFRGNDSLNDAAKLPVLFGTASQPGRLGYLTRVIFFDCTVPAASSL